jgi:splicing factor U2AF subunit
MAAATAAASAARGAPAAQPGASPEDAAAAAASWSAQQRAAALASRVATAARKAREVYCGNLLPGVVGPDLLRSFLDAALSGLPLPELAAGPPVLAVQPAGDGKYAFVEMRSEALAAAALSLHGLDLAGRALSVARPAGYTDVAVAAALGIAAVAAAASAAACAQPGAAGFAAAALACVLPSPPAPTAAVRLDNLVTINELLRDAEYAEVLAELRAEAAKHGAVTQLLLPRPSASTAAAFAAAAATAAPGDAAVAAAALAGVEPTVGKAYLGYDDVASAVAAAAAMHGRLFDGRTVAARFVWDDELRAVAEAQPAAATDEEAQPAAGEA